MWYDNKHHTHAKKGGWLFNGMVVSNRNKEERTEWEKKNVEGTFYLPQCQISFKIVQFKSGQLILIEHFSSGTIIWWRKELTPLGLELYSTSAKWQLSMDHKDIHICSQMEGVLKWNIIYFNIHSKHNKSERDTTRKNANETSDLECNILTKLSFSTW